jgi:hypothetical protein
MQPEQGGSMMKVLLSVLSLLLVAAQPAMCQDANSTGTERQESGCMPGKKMMGMGMMGMLAPRSMVASENGSVIVLVGNKLQKYDKDLNLVKEVEVKIDMGAMKKMMMENCPMMQGQEKQEGAGKNETGSNP